jgi:uncharacterized protein (DUF58 family)
VTRSGHGKLCVAPTLWPPVIGAAGLFSFAVVTHAVWPQLLGCALIGLIASSLFAVARPPHIDVQIELPARVVVGEPFETVLHIRNLGSRPSRPLIVRHRPLAPRRYVRQHATLVGALAGHEEVTVRPGRTPLARGVIEASQLEIDAHAPFGFFSRRTIVAVPGPLFVLPALTPALTLPLAAGARAGVVGRTNGLDVGAVRDWRPGDQVRNVQWRSTARTGRLTVLEREDLSAGSLVVLVVGAAGDAAFEASLATAAATAVSALHQGLAVVVITSAGEIRCAQLAAEGALLEFFARVDAAVPLEESLTRRALEHAGRGGTLIVAAAATTPVMWRDKVRSLAAPAGVHVIDLAQPQPSRTGRPS